MTKDLKIFTSYYFLTGLVLLLLNDFLLKDLFGNWFTGKLSDFVGLFIFSLFWATILQRHKNKVFIATALLFIWWKSRYSQNFIDIWNQAGLIHIARTVDYTDLIALTILPFAWYIYGKKERISIVRIYPTIPLFISLFAFTATSYQKDFDYNKTYTFPFSKNELVQKINSLKNDSLSDNLPLSLHIIHANDFTVDGADTSWYFSSGSITYNDTIWKYEKIVRPNDNSLYETKKTNEIDTVYKIKSPIRDSMYVDKVGTFFYYIPTEKYMKESKTGYCHSLKTKIKLDGNETSSSLTLVRIYTHNCMGMFEKTAQENERDNLLNAFETEFIDRIKNSP